jgi:tellurite resistance protein TehA-like permease
VAAVVSASKQDVEEALSGGWLLAAVATQSISVLAALLAPTASDPGALLLPALVFYLMGCMQYLLIIGPIFHRLIVLTISPQAWTPLFWINSGALSITTLAGAQLVLVADQWVFLRDILPFLQGFSVFFWAAATWWIPLLVLIGVWRHGLERFPLTYAPDYWGLVFPLGMYTACSFELVQATGLEPLLVIPRTVMWVALLAWAITGYGLLHRLVRRDVSG